MSQDETLQTIKYVTCAASIIGASSIIISSYKDERPAKRLLFYLSIADVGASVVYMFPVSKADSLACVIQSTLGIYFPVASFLWTDCIAVYVYLVVCATETRGALLRNSAATFMRFHILCWGLPLILVMVVWLSGHAGMWSAWSEEICWIKAKSDDDYDDVDKDDKSPLPHAHEVFVWQWVGGQAVESLSFAFICPIFYSLSLWRILKQEHYSRRLLNSSDDELGGACWRCPCSTWRIRGPRGGTASTTSLAYTSQSVRFTQFKWKLVWVPGIFIFIRSWSEARTIILYVRPELDAYWLQILQQIGDTCQGFFNGLLFFSCTQLSRSSTESVESATADLNGSDLEKPILDGEQGGFLDRAENPGARERAGIFDGTGGGTGRVTDLKNAGGTR